MENVLAPYEKTCTECREMGYIPNGYLNCLKCLNKKLKLQAWETICLQCGQITENLKGNNKFCWNCLAVNSKNFRKEFVDTLDEKQLILFEKYEAWDEARTSAIMLD